MLALKIPGSNNLLQILLHALPTSAETVLCYHMPRSCIVYWVSPMVGYT